MLQYTMQKPRERDIVVGAQLVHYYQVDSVGPQKNTLVFLHGWGSNSPLWFPSTLSLAEKGYELIFIDLPGFGRSQNPQKPFFLEEYAETVAGVVEKLEIRSPIVIGHSFGGKTAIRIASKQMVPLPGLVLVDSSGLPHTSFRTQVKIGIAKTVKPIFSIPLLQGVRTGLLRLSGSDDYVAFPELRETFINIISEHVTEELSRIAVPTMVIWGERDDNSYSPVGDAAVFQKNIQNTHIRIIKNAGHYCFLDQQQEFTDSLSSFVESIHV